MIQNYEQMSMSSDPKLAHLSTNLAQLGIEERRAELRRIQALGALTEAQIGTLQMDSTAATIAAQASLLEQSSEAAKTLFDITTSQVQPVIDAFMNRIENAKDDDEKQILTQSMIETLNNDPRFKEGSDIIRKLLSTTLGYQVKAEELTLGLIKRGWFNSIKGSEEAPVGDTMVLDPFGIGSGLTAEQEAASMEAARRAVGL
jgi:hypothetical protein